MLLLFLGAAEQEIEQTLGGRDARRQRNGAGEHNGSNRQHAAPHVQIKKRFTQRSLHPRHKTGRGNQSPQPD